LVGCGLGRTHCSGLDTAYELSDAS
jgi:hypothetical protein